MAKQIAAADWEAEQEGFDMEAASVFVANPRALTMVFTDKEADELKQYLSESKIKVIAHSSYVAMPWGGNPHAALFIRTELNMCRRAGISGLVVHLPNKSSEVVVKFLPMLFSHTQDVRIYLETPAVSPSKSFYETPEKLNGLFQAIRSKVDPNLSRTGLCVDTAHLWSCGVDISSRKAAEEWLHGLEKCADVIPPGAIMFHLNDSMYDRGDGRDEHATLLRGKIWEDYKDNPQDSGLAAFVEYAVANGTPAILERKPASALITDYRTLFSLSPALRLPDEEAPADDVKTEQ